MSFCCSLCNLVSYKCRCSRPVPRTDRFYCNDGVSMKMVVVAIFDSAAGCYTRPECVAAAPVAVRAFKDQVNNKQTAIGQHPDDYTLFELGEFDDGKASFSLHEEPIRLARGKDLVGG